MSTLQNETDRPESIESKQKEDTFQDQLDESVDKAHSDDDGRESQDLSSPLLEENPQGRHMGVLSAAFLMVNRIVGTGVFATTSTLLSQSGSVGMSLLYWVIGAAIAFAGFAVYAEFATAMPRNGGELNYLQRAFQKPKHLVTIMYASQAILLGQAAGNAYTAGQYFIRSGGGASNQWGARGIGVAILISALIMHGCFMRWGLLFQNTIGIFKIVILLLISISGFVALAGHTKGPAPDNFTNAFAGTRGDIYGVAQCIYNAVWSYIGYSNLFYAVGEVRHPVRTIKRAGFLALFIITILYVLVQVAYYAAVPREEVLGSEQIIAALYFKHMFGESSARALSVFVALSAVANVFSVIFSQGRLNQALGREGFLPFSKILASNRPFKAPLAGLGWHVIVTLIFLLAPPAGDAYNFVLNLSSYPLNVVNTAVGIALCSTYLPHRLQPQWARTNWSPPFKATFPVAIFFTLVSAFLVIVPWIPPKNSGDAVYTSLWYAMAPAVSVGIFASGAVYWLLWAHILPRIFHYTLVPVPAILSDGTLVTRYQKDRKV